MTLDNDRLSGAGRSRRGFLGGAGGRRFRRRERVRAPGKDTGDPPKKVAAVVTEYRRHSHADILVGKILEGYLHDGKSGPNLRVVSMFVDQFPANDLSRDLAKKHGFTICDSIAEALTLQTGPRRGRRSLHRRAWHSTPSTPGARSSIRGGASSRGWPARS